MSNVEPYQRDDGTWMIPKRADSADGQTTGIGWVPLTPEEDDHDAWVVYIRQRETRKWSERVSDGLPR